ncbi:MAG: glutathione synthase [Alphaproteobacteria bacterium]|nr:glutathione synthase [Alphaproteobacteria bacterium]
MIKNVALQMDIPHNIDITSDSSYMLGMEAQKRGYQLYYYPPELLSWDSRRGVFAKMQTLKFTQDPQKPAELGETETINLAAIDVVLMRQDPPFDMGYITATHLLEQAETCVVNNPSGVRNAPEKIWVNLFKQFMPHSLISHDKDEIKQFHRDIGEIIIKPLYGNGGFGIFKLDKDDTNLDALLELFFAQDNIPLIAQQYLPNISKGDKRVVLIDGEIAGAINRVPQKGNVRSNLHVGGIAEKAELTKRDIEICEGLKQPLKQEGLLFAGIDIIDGHLTEINVTSPTGIQEINHFNNACLQSDIWNAIEKI